MIAVLKPTYLCNLRCSYCYLPEEQKSKLNKWSLSFAKDVINKLVDYIICNRQGLTIIWHGGEPLLWGVDKFNMIFDYIKQLCECKNIIIKNIVQTNLTLITPQYIDLFTKYDVRVSFSIDGPQIINDKTRLKPNGQGAFQLIKEKIDLCINSGLALSCVVVGNRNHIGRIKELYTFLNSLGIKSFKFNPIFNNGDDSYNTLGISGEEYAEMVIELFDIWYADNYAQVYETNLVEICSNIVTSKPRACHFRLNCQDYVLAISPKGEVCPCGRFCEDSDKYTYGNIRDISLDSIISNQKKSSLYRRADYLQNGECSCCEFWNICAGGCPHDALSYSNNYLNKTFLCSAYKRIFTHISNRLNKKE